MTQQTPSGFGIHDLPNLITVLRMAAVVPLVWLMLGQFYQAAFWLAVVAGASDAIDGFLAKRFDWVSRLGGVLDPLADKLLLLTCYVLLAVLGQVPVWLVVLVLLRDVIIVAGATTFHFLFKPVDAEPSLLSKLNTFVQIVQVLVIMWALAYGWSNQIVIQAMIWIVAVTTVGSGVHYVAVWGYRAWAIAREEGHQE